MTAHRQMTAYRVALTASAALLAGAFLTTGASAMPLGGLAGAADNAALTETIAWVCGPYRCGWRPGPAFYGPRAWYGPAPYRFGWYGPRRHFWR